MGNLVVIPARLQSTRLTEKLLLNGSGTPLILHAVKRAAMSQKADKVVVATDHQRIAHVVSGEGFEVIMTREDHPSGTDRIAEVVKQTDAKRIVNVQGDEPFIEPDLIDTLFDQLEKSDAPMVTAVYRHDSCEGLEDASIAKVVCDHEGNAIYFSRSLIPFDREGDVSDYFSHIGIYGYSREFVLQYPQLPKGPLEKAERLEQLRALENGHKIKAVETKYQGFSVDTTKDYEKFLEKVK